MEPRDPDPRLAEWLAAVGIAFIAFIMLWLALS
jgi:hypothetical protein